MVQHGSRLATAESCTGGWVAKCVTDVPGSSAWFEAGLVTYSNRAKETLLGVPRDLLIRHGAVSEAVVREMAAGALRVTDADRVIAVTGIAGPSGGTEDKPVGLVWLAWGRRGDDELTVACERFAGNRGDVRRQTVARALRTMSDVLAG